MAITDGNYVPSPVPNTTLLEKLRDGVLYRYMLKADDGYVLHDKNLDIPEIDDRGNETGVMILWFRGGTTTVLLDYDFDNTTQGTYTYRDENGIEVSIPVTMMGSREFYTVPRDIVPENQLLGGTVTDPPVTE